MEERIELTVEARETRGKNAARRLRADGKAPATLYGQGAEAMSLAVDAKIATRILASEQERNRILTLQGGAEGLAMAYDFQADPVTGALLHVDLLRVALDQSVLVQVPIKTRGVAIGVKNEGGIEDLILRRVRARCLPEAVPAQIEIDMEPLRSGEAIRVEDLPVSEGVELLEAPTAVVVRIVGKRAMQAEAEAILAEAEGPEAAEEEVAEEGAETPEEEGEEVASE